MKKIPISIVSNIFNPCGPSVPGGLEVFNYYLTKALEQRGYDIRLYASGDSAKLTGLIPLVKKSLLYSQTDEYISVPWNLRRLTVEEFAVYTNFIQKAEKEKRLIHFSLVNFLPIYLAVKKNLPALTTMHISAQNLHFQTLIKLLSPEELKKIHFVSVSHTQIKNFPYAYDTVYNGVKIENKKFSFFSKYKNNFIWIGRMIPEKGCFDAILAAKKANVILEIGGSPKSSNEKEYFENIKKYFNSGIRYQGYINAKKRNNFYKAKALLFPSKIEECFSLIVIEAMACGTPIIAYDQGSVREAIIDGKTGFIVPKDNIKELMKAIKKINSMDETEYQEMRRNCRKRVEQKFSLDTMVDKYEQIYQKIYAER
jgi:glycosyltransferase involved in cell wall biosynthesis